MQGKRNGLATLFRKEVPAALPVHCLAHCLNLCLQDAGRQIQLLRDSIDLIRGNSKIDKLFSKKKAYIFRKVVSQ